ncbi:MAG: DUF1467 family protein [Hyphomicrobiaceae bacterium]
MNYAFMIAIYFILWWITLFVVLPFGVKTQQDAGTVVPGTPAGAPADFRLGRVLLITTLVTLVIFAVLWGLVHEHIVDPYALFGAPTNPVR